MSIARHEIMLERMRSSLHPRSRLFRSLLVLALLAWTALAFDAFAHPLGMVGEATAKMAMVKAAPSHCNGMAMAQSSHASHPAPSHPAGSGHGCCANGACHCASLCSGIAGVPYLDVAIQPSHDPILVPFHVAPALTHSAPPLRPPIV